MREVLNGVLCVLETGCQWCALPKDLPPKSTVHDYLMLWDWDGTREPHASRALPHDPGSGRLRGLAKRRGDRQPERERRGKRAARIDPPGYDPGKKVKGNVAGLAGATGAKPGGEGRNCRL